MRDGRDHCSPEFRRLADRLLSMCLLWLDIARFLCEAASNSITEVGYVTGRRERSMYHRRSPGMLLS